MIYGTEIERESRSLYYQYLLNMEVVRAESGGVRPSVVMLENSKIGVLLEERNNVCYVPLCLPCHCVSPIAVCHCVSPTSTIVSPICHCVSPTYTNVSPHDQCVSPTVPLCRRTTNVSPQPYHCVAAQPMCLPNRTIVSPTLLTKISCFFFILTPLPPALKSSIYYIFILLSMEYGYYFWWNLDIPRVNMLSFWDVTSYPFEILQGIYYTVSMWLFSFI